MAVSVELSEEVIHDHVRRIRDGLLARSACVREDDFRAIHPGDLKFLFDSYDECFFSKRCAQTLDGSKLHFRLSPRMTRAGGKTTRFTSRTGEHRYEIAIASSMLFDGFSKEDRRVTVCGIECVTRLEALQRIFEHEVVHLIELLCWDRSDCSAARFQDIAARFFQHRAHTHNLITRRERAAESGIRVGSRVTFNFEGQRLTGRVNRVTKRATVLVEDPEGQSYSNGLRYKTYYVPIAMLRPESAG